MIGIAWVQRPLVGTSRMLSVMLAAIWMAARDPQPVPSPRITAMPMAVSVIRVIQFGITALI
jgi:hypothetical protein